MSRRCIPNGMFSITHYLPKRKKTDNKGSPLTGNNNISTRKKLTLWKTNSQVNKYAQNQKVENWKNYIFYWSRTLIQYISDSEKYCLSSLFLDLLWILWKPSLFFHMNNSFVWSVPLYLLVTFIVNLVSLLLNLSKYWPIRIKMSY